MQRMSQHQFHKKLSKISALTDGGETLDKLSALERDLLLGYIRELYEIVLETAESKAHAANVQIKASAPAVKPIPEMPHDATGITFHNETVHVSEPIVKHVEQKIPVANPVVEPVVIPEVSQYVVVQDKVPTPIVKAIPEMPHDATGIISHSETVSAPEPAIRPHVVALQSDAVNEIFAVGVISALSDKLANAPISDLNKAMGINERMFTQQELFGNDAQAFANTLKKMNSCDSFEEARQYLLDHVIYTYDWTSDAKIKKASTFVRLVRRRYL
jgi:hypothetical protein